MELQRADRGMIVGASSQSVFCQIAERETSVSNCNRIQGQEGCFGCSAASRRCERCEEHPVAVPVTGFCDVCLTIEIQKEQQVSKPVFVPGTQVACQLVHRDIGVQTCFTMQGDDKCRDCGAPSRLCVFEGCERPVRIVRAGFCLTHTVAELGDGWNALSDGECTNVADEMEAVQMAQTEVLREHHAEKEYEDVRVAVTKPHAVSKRVLAYNRHFAKDSIVLGLLSDARDYVSHRETVSIFAIQKRFSTSFERARVVMNLLEQEGIVGPHRGHAPRFVVRQVHESEEESNALFGEDIVRGLESDAENLVKEHRYASVRLLIKELHTSYPNAKELIRRLEERGVVGPHMVYHPRNVSVNPTSVCATCGKSGVLARKTGVCRKCAAARCLKKFAESEDGYAMVAKVKNYIADRDFISQRELKKVLNTSNERTHMVVRRLEEEGFLDKAYGRMRRRQVLKASTDNAMVVVSHGDGGNTLIDHEQSVFRKAVSSGALIQESWMETVETVRQTVEDQKKGIQRLIAVIGADGEFCKLLQSVVGTLESIQNGYVTRAAHERCIQEIRHALDCVEIHDERL